MCDEQMRALIFAFHIYILFVMGVKTLFYKEFASAADIDAALLQVFYAASRQVIDGRIGICLFRAVACDRLDFGGDISKHELKAIDT